MAKYKTPTHAELLAIFEKIDSKLARYPGHHGARADNRTRIERALSWFGRYEQARAKSAPEELFIFLWISFNAAFGDDEHLKNTPDEKAGTRVALEKFFRLLVDLDESKHLDRFMLARHDNFRAIMKNRFLFGGFWKAEYRRETRKQWERYFKKDQTKMSQALRTICKKDAAAGDVCKALELAFDRLYTLRNQIIHGSASWLDEYNRSSLKTSNAVLSACVPEILRVMLEAMRKKPDIRWGGLVAYPPYLEKRDDETKEPPQRLGKP